MAEIQPRFEFRTWARTFGRVVEKMRAFSPCEKIQESAEIYVVSGTNNRNNTRVRNKLMDIRQLVADRDGLEQWSPRMKGAFPIDMDILRAEVFPAFEVEMPPLARDRSTLDQYLAKAIRRHPDLAAVNVFKRRFAVTVNDCITEHAEIFINGAAIQTVAVESTDVDAMREARRMLGLDDYENVNCLRAIKRVIGMELLPA